MSSTRDTALLVLAATLGAIVALLVFLVAKVPLVNGIAQVVMMLAGILMIASVSAISRYLQSAHAMPSIHVSFDGTQTRQALEGLAVKNHEISDALDPVQTSWEPTLDTLMIQDPALALAKLRIDLERELRRISFENDIPPTRRLDSIGGLIDALKKSQVLDLSVVQTLADVLPACNLAIHGGAITPDVALSVLDVGEELIKILRVRYRGARRQQAVS